MKKLLILGLLVPSAVFGGEIERYKGNSKHAFASLPYVNKLVNEEIECVRRARTFNLNAEEEYSDGSLAYIRPLAIEFATWQEKDELIKKRQSILEEMRDVFMEKSILELMNNFLFQKDHRRGHFKSEKFSGMGPINGKIFSLTEKYDEAGGSKEDIDKCRQEAREYVQYNYHVTQGQEGQKVYYYVTDKQGAREYVKVYDYVAQEQEGQKVFHKNNSSLKPFLFKTAGVTTFVGLTGWLTYNNKGRIVAGADRLTNGAFSQYTAALWNKVPVMPKFNFSRPQFSGFGSGVGLGLFGNKAQSAFVGARSYVSNVFGNFWNK